MPKTKTLIDEAIAFETEGLKLYTDLTAKAITALAKSLFQSLAQQEKDHIGFIQNYVRNKTFKPYNYQPIEQTIKKLFSQIQGEAKDLSQQTGYEFALRLEAKGYNLYKNAAAQADNPEDKKFYGFLQVMENEHYSALANVYYYLTSNDQWVSENESQTWNWMNLG